MTTDFTKLLEKLVPEPGGEDVLRLRTGVVSAIGASSGAVTVTVSGVDVPNVPVLGSAMFPVGSVVQILSYRGSLLIIGASGSVTSTSEAGTYASTDESTTTSTSFVTSLTGGTAVTGMAFVSPPSGMVFVTARAAARNGTANSYAILDFQVRTGSVLNSGTIFRAANENTAGVIQSTTADLQATIVSSDLVVGLTPGVSYNVTLAFHAGTSGTAKYNRRQAIVLPQ
jgi:hypothetical protein